MATAEDIQRQFAQQRQNIEQARQSAVAARQNLANYPVYETPTASQLRQRGMLGAAYARQAEASAKQQAKAEEKRISEYESTIAESEKQLKSQESEFQRQLTEQQEFESGRKLSHSTDPFRVSALTSPAMKAGYKYGMHEERYAQAKIQYQKDLASPPQQTYDYQQLDKEVQAAEPNRFTPIYEGDKIVGYNDSLTHQSIPVTDKGFSYTPSSEIKKQQDAEAAQKAKENNIFVKALKSVGIFPSISTKMGISAGKTIIAKMGEKGQLKPELTVKEASQVYKNTPYLGGVYGIFSAVGEETSKILNAKIGDKGQTMGSLLIPNVLNPNRSLEPTPLQKTVQAGIKKIPSDVYSRVALWGFFSPLMSLGAGKKTSKQVVVEEKKAEEAPKISNAEKLRALRAKILENAITNPAANRDALIKIYESGDKEAAKAAEKLLIDSLGSDTASQIIADAKSQAIIPEIIPKITPTKAHPSTEEEKGIAISSYWGDASYSFAEVQTMTSKILGATPVNLKYAGLLSGLTSSLGLSVTKPLQLQTNVLGLKTKQIQTLQQEPIALQKISTLTLQSPISLQIPQLITSPITKQAPILKTQLNLQKPIPIPESIPIWLKIPPTKEFGKKKMLDIFKKRKISKAYQLFVKRKGKYKAIGMPMPKGRASLLGETIVGQTLARTFALKPTTKQTAMSDIIYKPSGMLRGYKIRKGKRIPLQNEWIQRARYSLSSMGERREIQRARKSRLKWI